jgi:hypothetical protein
VTPSENVRSSPLSDVEDETTDTDSQSSSEYSDVDSDVYNSDTECKERTVNGNRLINLPSLVHSIQASTVCRCCADESTDVMFESLVNFCEAEMNRIKHKVEGKPIKYQLTRFRDRLSICNCYQRWRSTKQVRQHSVLQVREHTYGLATNIQLQCSGCNNSVFASAKKRSNPIQKSELCQYDVNIKYCTALQIIGVGGEHAATLAAFLELSDPQKWSRQFAVLDRHLHLPAEAVKLQSQQQAAEEEVAHTLGDERYIVPQHFLLQDLPVHNVEASFDMGWQVRSSGGKYGSSTGHALLIGARSRKVLDSVIFNKKCGVCTKHKKRTGIANDEKVCHHYCVKNYDGSSKSMEAAALVKMLLRIPEETSISISTIISDDDSNARAKARH